MEANLKDLQTRVASITRLKKPVPPNLQMQLAQSEKESLELKRTTLQNEQAMVQVREKYAADKQRFKSLLAKTP